MWAIESLSIENQILKLKVRGVQTETSCKDGLGCILKSFGCVGDEKFAYLPMYYDYKVSPVRFQRIFQSNISSICNFREKCR